jgi:hypothetical protein
MGARVFPQTRNAHEAIVKWEYQIVRADSAEAFLASLNVLGAEGWEAISGGYGAGESKKVSLGQACRC